MSVIPPGSLPDILMSAQYSALKQIYHDTVDISLPAGTQNNASARIPHDYGSDELIYYVVARDKSGNTGNNMVLPFSNSSASLIAFANMTDEALYIRIGTNTFTSFPATVWECEYWIFVP